MMRNCALFLCILAVFGGLGSRAVGYVAESTNYRIQADSINFGGGVASSGSYGLQSTLGEVGTGTSTDGTSIAKIGYPYMIGGGTISITSPADVTLSPALDGVRGGEASGTAGWTVTSEGSGYALYVKAGADPALSSASDEFEDYSPAFADTPDYSWVTDATKARFGFSPEGDDIVDKYQDNGSSCNAGSSDTVSRCWEGFSTSDEEVAERGAATGADGIETTLRLKAEIGDEIIKQQGTYTAEITVTVLPL